MANLSTLIGGSLVNFGEIPQNSQGGSYELVLSDAGKHILHPSNDNNARTYTIPSNANVAFAVGTSITFINLANTITIAIDTDNLKLAGTSANGSMALYENGIATAIKISSTEWMISGIGLDLS